MQQPICWNRDDYRIRRAVPPHLPERGSSQVGTNAINLISITPSTACFQSSSFMMGWA